NQTLSLLAISNHDHFLQTLVRRLQLYVNSCPSRKVHLLQSEADVSENERGVCILRVENEDSVIAGSSSIAGSLLDDVYTGKRLPSFIRDLTGDRDEGVGRLCGDHHQASAHAAIGK